MKTYGNVSASMRQRLGDVEAAWSSASGRAAIGISENVLTLSTPEGLRSETWDNVTGLHLVGRDKVQFNFGTSDAWTHFQFAAASHRDHFFQAVPEQDQSRLANDTRQPAPERVVGRPQASQTSVIAGDSASGIWKLLWAGVALQFIGGFIIGGISTSLELESLTGEPAFGGNDLVQLLGWTLAGAGTLVAMVAVIAFGVRLGIRAAGDSRN